MGEKAPVHVFQYENVLGSSLEIKVSAANVAAAEKAGAAALAEIDRVAKIISTYDPESAYSHWFRTVNEPVHVPDELLEVFALYDRWQARSDGVLSAGAEAVSRVWKEAAREQKPPDSAALEKAAGQAGQKHWKLDLASGTATHLDQIPLSLNAAGKGFIVGRACDAAARVPGVDGVVVNIGGDLAVRGDVSETVDIADPRNDAENAAPIARIAAQDAAVATSGNYRRGMDIAGRHYSHIVDPRTGESVDRVISATAVAPHAADADALATIFSVLTPDESLKLAAQTPGVACLLITSDGRRVASPGWQALEAAASSAASDSGVRTVANASTPAPVADGAWDPAFELIVNFEIARITTGRAKRPFVAVWIEDKDHFPVRTLALWFKGARWLPDLRSWYHGDQLRGLAEGTQLTDSVSSATRSPGKYSLTWGGLDNAGKPVKAGKYTVLIEAAREHGTRQLMQHEMDFAGAPQKVDLPGNEEIAAASLDYRRKPATAKVGLVR